MLDIEKSKPELIAELEKLREEIKSRHDNDIDERNQIIKSLAESENRYRDLVENSVQGVIIAQTNPLRLSFVSKPMESITGYTQDELTSFSPEQLLELIHPEERKKFITIFEKRISGEEVSSLNEFRMFRKDGSIRFVEAFGTQIEYDNSPAVHVLYLDITDRKQFINKLKLSEKKFHNIFDSVAIGIAVSDIDGNLLSANRGYQKISGFSEEELLNTSAPNLYKNPCDRSRMLELLEKQKYVNNFEVELKRSSGEYFFASLNVKHIIYDDKPALLSIIDDITDRKNAEISLIESEEKFRTFAENAPGIVCIYDVDKDGIRDTIYFSSGLDQLLNLNTALKIDNDINRYIELIHLDDYEGFQNTADYSEATDSLFDYEYRVMVGNGEYKWVRSIAQCSQIENKKNRWHCQIVDVTGRKLSEEAIRETEERFRTLVEQSPAPIEIYDPKGILLIVNDAWAKFWGLKKDSVAGFNILDDPECQKTGLTAAFKEAQRNRVEIVPEILYDAEGSGFTGSKKRWISVKMYPIIDNKEKVKNIVLTYDNITERKAAEEVLRNNEEKYRSILINAPAIIYRCHDDKDWTLIFFSGQIEQITGYPYSDFVDNSVRTFASITHPDDLQMIEDVVHESIEQKRPYVIEYRIIHKNGNIVWLHDEGKGFFEDGELKWLEGVEIDITEQKLAEEALKNSEKSYRTMTENIPGVVYRILCQDDNRMIFFNDNLKEISGYSSSEINKGEICSIEPYIHPEDLQYVVSTVRNAIRKKTHFEVEYRFLHKDGSIRYFSETGRPIFDSDSNLVSIDGIILDATKRWQVEKELSDHQKRSQAWLSYTPICTKVIDLDFNLQFMSESGAELLNVKDIRKFYGKRYPLEFYPEDYFDTMSASMETAVRSSEKVDHEGCVTDVNGEELWFHSTIVPVKDDNGCVEYLTIVSMEISERKKAENALKESESKYKKIATNIPGVVYQFTVNNDGTYSFPYIDESCVKFFGNSAEAIQNDANLMFDLVPPDESKLLTNSIERAVSTISEWRHDFNVVSPSGKEYWFEGRAVPQIEPSGNTVWNGVLTDITERKMAEEELDNSQRFLNSILDQSPDPTWIADLDGTMIRANQALLNVLNLQKEQLVGKYNPFNDPQLEPHIIQAVHDALDDGKATDVAFSWRGEDTDDPNLKDSNTVHCEGTIFPIIDQKGSITNAVITYKDVSEKIIAAIALKKSESKFRAVIEQSKDAIFIHFNNKFDLVNKRFTELTGLTFEDTERADFDYLDSIAPESRSLMEERIKIWDSGEKPPNVYEYKIKNKNGTIYHVQASVTEIDYRDSKASLVILRDVTEQKALEEQLRQVQKIESIGHLAGGIAHDFNNLLTPIIGTSELAMLDLNPSNTLYDDMKEIHETANRAASLTRQLLAFSRKQVLDMKVVDLNKLVENFRNILRRTIREDIKINVNYGTFHEHIRVDVSQIEQILMNLYVNAQDAIESGGTITLTTESVVIDDKYAERHVDIKSGKYVMFSVSDTGEGIDESLVQKIFDPFFTTKEVGKGTGLGLSTVYGIIKQHGGNIVVNSEPGLGTTFKLFLPAIVENISKTSETFNRIKYSSKVANILVVEDQEQVRRIASRILSTVGYSVHVASSGQMAISMLEDNNFSIDLLLADVIMPEMNGKELYDCLIDDHPNLKVLYMSGYTQDVIAKHGVLEEDINFIQKPLTVDGLAAKVQEVLLGSN